MRRVLALLASAFCSCGGAAPLSQIPPPRHIPIALDLDSPGRRFDGLGGLSAGASSRALLDYVEPQRGQLLDYLFAPQQHGFNYQILKLEVGGDCQSSWGTEASHQHTEGDENYQRGYEFWLAKEAKRHNPDLVLASLAWCEPGWISPGVLSPAGVDYHIRWLQGAKREHNLSDKQHEHKCKA